MTARRPRVPHPPPFYGARVVRLSKQIAALPLDQFGAFTLARILESLAAVMPVYFPTFDMINARLHTARELWIFAQADPSVLDAVEAHLKGEPAP